MTNKTISHLYKGNTNSTIIQLFRYTWVGGIAFIADYLSLYLLTEYGGMPYLWSAAVAFIIGLVVNYTLSVTWVFNGGRMGNKWAEFTVFALIGVVGLGLNELIMYVGSGILGMHYMLSKLVSTGIVFFWNFFARKVILFSTNRKKE